MKANDNIPADEMLLAEALQAAHARGMKHTAGATFRDANERIVMSSKEAVSCCAIGALAIAGRVDERVAAEQCTDTEGKLSHVYFGNDQALAWSTIDADVGESLGWAFRCAMTQEEP